MIKVKVDYFVNEFEGSKPMDAMLNAVTWDELRLMCLALGPKAPSGEAQGAGYSLLAGKLERTGTNL